MGLTTWADAPEGKIKKSALCRTGEKGLIVLLKSLYDMMYNNFISIQLF